MYEHVIITVFRKTAATKLNPHSSRSHSIVLIKVFSQEIYVAVLFFEFLDQDYSFTSIHRIHKWRTLGKKLVPSHESEELEGKQNFQ